MSTALSVNQNSKEVASQQQYMRLPLAVFQMYKIADVDLYCEPNSSNTPILYRSGTYPLTQADIEDLERRGHKALYVSLSSFATIQKELVQGLDEIVEFDQIPATERFAALQAAVAMEVDIAFQLIRTDKFVTLTRRVVNCISKLFDDEPVLPRSLFDIVQHDFFTFTHVTNVAAYSMLLAEELGISDIADRRKIAEGAMLHDIGKRFVPAEILCKPGKLTNEQRQVVQAHPTRGYLDLRKSAELSQNQLMMVYQHHERIDGSGYPVRILGEEIDPWAKLLAVIDVFDALTSKRPYRNPMKITDALEMLQRSAGSHFDPEIVQCWNLAIRKN